MAVVAVIGLGYVGLPLAIAFGQRMRTIGLDSAQAKIDSLTGGLDPSGIASTAELLSADQLSFTADAGQLALADFIIVAVPTPIDAARKPDFGPLVAASESIGAALRQGTTVIFESTVYPGATEEVCIPVIESVSGLVWKRDFQVGYSPERINPGDRLHTLANTVKVVAGDSADTLARVAALYETVVEAGVHKVSSIAVAEAAKVIENTQRDLNIALMNELALIFNRMGLDTLEVLEAAGTKWNFMPFRPGLVGGHCIGVDPYYLTYKAEMLGYHPEVILAGRRINDGMGKYIAEQTIKQMIQAGCSIKGAKVNVLGITFKEDVPDVRNTRVIDVVHELGAYGVDVYVHDPVADASEVHKEYGVSLTEWQELPVADALVLAVAHEAYFAMGASALAAKTRDGGTFIDVKARASTSQLQAAGLKVWRL